MHWKGFVTWLLQQSMSSVRICKHHLAPVCHTQLQTQQKFRQSPKDITSAGGRTWRAAFTQPSPGCPTVCTLHHQSCWLCLSVKMGCTHVVGWAQPKIPPLWDGLSLSLSGAACSCVIILILLLQFATLG